MFPEGFAASFWAKVKKSRGCWEWQRGTTRAGYGQLQARRVSRQPLLAHRVSWMLTYGAIPDGLHVLHDCDNPACVRPSHLFLGTQTDNNKDRDRKGRTAAGDRNGSRTRPGRNPFVRNRGSGLYGDAHPRTTLSDARVAQMRRDFARGVPKSTLARKYGVSQTHAGRIVAGKSRRQPCRGFATRGSSSRTSR